MHMYDRVQCVSLAFIINLFVQEHNLQAFIDPAFIFCSGNTNPTYFSGMMDMCAAIGLQIKSNNLHDTHLFDVRWEQINLCSYQIWYLESFFPR
jgi:hypothetical protein